MSPVASGPSGKRGCGAAGTRAGFERGTAAVLRCRASPGPGRGRAEPGSVRAAAGLLRPAGTDTVVAFRSARSPVAPHLVGDQLEARQG